MTSQGTAHGRFERAIHRRHLLAAEMAAREMGGVARLVLSIAVGALHPTCERDDQAATRLHSPREPPRGRRRSLPRERPLLAVLGTGQLLQTLVRVQVLARKTMNLL
jgi:hypothetical protein